eukprot:CAMPEP_0116916204 /NCGR_PEP_ID=MMETSP0467-20121206/18388_1 /TAXON_ID=283647 /ORGANISM="Mesodinium pulex, Strain SPMC105" /LENGTH=109 /DNA_ID=CAMNT_0004593021 /DNA_START=797 /DNA_END=1126 /DNA_ORIENTATION=+
MEAEKKTKVEFVDDFSDNEEKKFSFKEFNPEGLLEQVEKVEQGASVNPPQTTDSHDNRSQKRLTPEEQDQKWKNFNLEEQAQPETQTQQNEYNAQLNNPQKETKSETLS